MRLTNGIVVDTSIGYTTPGKYQLSIAEQCYRFIDSEVKYGDHEVDVLLRYVFNVYSVYIYILHIVLSYAFKV